MEIAAEMKRRVARGNKRYEDRQAGKPGIQAGRHAGVKRGDRKEKQ